MGAIDLCSAQLALIANVPILPVIPATVISVLTRANAVGLLEIWVARRLTTLSIFT